MIVTEPLFLFLPVCSQVVVGFQKIFKDTASNSGCAHDSNFKTAFCFKLQCLVISFSQEKAQSFG